MKKTLGLLFFCCLLMSSCSSNNKKGCTDMDAATYLSEIEGLVLLGNSEYEIPCGEDVLYIDPGVCFNTIHSENHISYVGLSMRYLLCKKDLELSSYYPIFDDMNSQDMLYLTGADIRQDNFAYILEEYNCKTNPEWSEWIDFEISSKLFSSPHGRSNAYWYNPVSETYEKCVYIKENDTSTEIYVIYHDISLFLNRYSEYSSYLISEELYNKIQTEFPDLTLSSYFRKGTVEEFSRWFMGEYLEEVPEPFADIKEEFYYLKSFDIGKIIYDYSEIHGYDPIELLISDMKSLGVNFDEVKAQIIKVTVPHNGTLNDILWELIY